LTEPQAVEVVVGRVGRAHGLRGEVSVDLRTDEPARRFAAGVVVACGAASYPTLTVQRARPHGSRWLVTFAEISDRDAAEALRGAMLTLEVPPDERPADPSEYYDHQLVGLRAVTTDGDHVGAVQQLVHLPAQDLLSIRRTDGLEVLVPFVAELVPEVDQAAGTLTIAPLAGLLDPDNDEADASAAGPGRPRPR
jgi:16S rRNA processing protein RimM